MTKILVIDDDSFIRKLLRRALENKKFEVIEASNGLEGIEKFEKNSFDLVITDFQMPGIDGNGVAKHIRNSKRGKTPVVGISGTPWLLEDNDFDAILEKPTSMKKLVDTVTRIAQSN